MAKKTINSNGVTKMISTIREAQWWWGLGAVFQILTFTIQWVYVGAKLFYSTFLS